jgi:hypothetical protein
MHVLAGHGLFHSLLDSFLDAEQPNVLVEFHAECKKYLESQPTMDPRIDRLRLDQMIEEVRQVWRRALEELLCDFGCVAIFGPAAIFAALSFFAGSSFDQAPSAPDYYPPFRYRLRAMFKYGFGQDGHQTQLDDMRRTLARSSHCAPVLETFEERWKSAEEQTVRDDDIKSIELSEATKIAYRRVESLLSSGWAHAQSFLANSKLPWIHNYKEIPTHLQSLSMLVPCGEIRQGDPFKASSITSILIAAWLHELLEQAQSSLHEVADDLIKKYLRSSRLLLKFLEDSELKNHAEPLLASVKGA